MYFLRRKWPRTVLAGLAALGAAAATPAVAAARANHNGYVYVNDNTAGRNTVAAFARQADGQLAEVAGSPFDAGGAGPVEGSHRKAPSRSRATAAT